MESAIIKSIQVNGLGDLPHAARQIIEHAGKKSVWIFDGEMGAGKTTLIQELCHQLDVQDTVSSPTFSIVNEYESKKGQTFYHFDCYRLQDEWEAMDIGLEEYLESGNICMIEWASKIANLIPDNFYHIHIELVDEHNRLIHLKHIDEEW